MGMLGNYLNSYYKSGILFLVVLIGPPPYDSYVYWNGGNSL